MSWQCDETTRSLPLHYKWDSCHSTKVSPPNTQTRLRDHTLQHLKGLYQSEQGRQEERRTETAASEASEIISSIFSGYGALKLEISCKKKLGQPTNTWRLNNTLLKNDGVKQEIKGDQKLQRDK